MKKTYNVVDMFCRAGGESTGIMQAAGEQGLKVNLLAINHWERAIETHAANHPGAEHLCQSVEHIDPTAVIHGKVNLLWASPECTHHSIARGGRPRSNQSRASAWLILKWLSELYVERVIIENVPEFLSWGPLDSAGRPIQKRKGEIFRIFISALQSFGYAVDWKLLTAADYGDPTTRRRLFIQAARGKKRIMWPEITQMGGDGNNLMGYRPWRPARDIIDWSIPGTSIFDRKRPLADATIRRIAAGIEKYWKGYAKPFLAVLYGTSKASSLDMPLSAITGSGAHHALIEPVPLIQPFILPNEGFFRGNQARSIDGPLNTITSRGAGALIEPFITAIGQSSAKDRSRSLDDPLSTIVGKQEHVLVEPLLVEYHGTSKPYPVSQPVKIITTKDRFALLEPFNEYALDIRFRMLKNHELKRAQGFPDDYILTGNVTEQTKQIGNAVPVNTARALAKAGMGA